MPGTRGQPITQKGERRFAREWVVTEIAHPYAVPMQGFFSMFPSGRAGIALLFLRTSVAAAFLLGALLGSYSLPVTVVSAGVALSLFAGFATPICATLCTLAGAVFAFKTTGATTICAALVALTSLALALIGPGAYSLDARVFGRRRIVFTSRK